jgi:hypothetical protein
LADVYHLANPGGFDVSGSTAQESTAPAWDGRLPFDGTWQDWRVTDYGNNAHSVCGREMWSARLYPDAGNGFWVFMCDLNAGGGGELLWTGTRPFENGIAGDYTRVDGCDTTTQTVTITEAP